ncbi:rod shape-determining protein MreC [Vitreoscilla filiformis]|uniref:Cell shape-determining protein MreC n=1 Tax=Vitreoscilla filiformis TaxID=63 RepID=A0A221KC27_VITFI|nr:rod shape-determining protein MreC [Vitreoscilla filiformis]ASM76535.1 rod shape-determining protein MreC [Vitreoscilla filiformis]
MPLGTVDCTPPPLFRQGISALTKLGLYSAAAIFLMVADTRLALTGPLRNVLVTALLPVQQVVAWPGGWVDKVATHFGGLERALAREKAAHLALAHQSLQEARLKELQRENDRLRTLLELRPSIQVKSLAAEVLYEAADPYSRKVIIDRGSQHGVVTGSPVITEAGVLGQVGRVYLLTSEVILLVDRDAAIPVLNARTGHRAAAFGGADPDLLELRFVAANDDVHVGDALTTSGVDGVYPAGLAVGKILTLDRRGDSGFARILLSPAVVPDSVRHALVLEPIGHQLPERPSTTEALSRKEKP